MGYDLGGKGKVRGDREHGRSNPHPVHGSAFGGKKAPAFAKKHPMKEEQSEHDNGKGSAQEESEN